MYNIKTRLIVSNDRMLDSKINMFIENHPDYEITNIQYQSLSYVVTEGDPYGSKIIVKFRDSALVTYRSK